MGTTWISSEHWLFNIQSVTPKQVCISGSKINDNGVSTLKQACSREYSGSLKLNN